MIHTKNLKIAKEKWRQRDKNDLQNTTQKTNDRTTRTLLKPEMHAGAPTWEAVLAPCNYCIVKGKCYTDEKQWLLRTNCKEEISPRFICY